MPVYLIGMPGSGKSTFGEKAAWEFNCSFIDLDHEIEMAAGINISEIFESKGEEEFRILESKILEEQSSKDNMIVATGGGTPCFFDNMNVMRGKGTVIFVDTPVDILIERIAVQDVERPLFKNSTNPAEDIKNLYKKRISIYNQAHYTVSSYEELKSVVQKIFK